MHDILQASFNVQSMQICFIDIRARMNAVYHERGIHENDKASTQIFGTIAQGLGSCRDQEPRSAIQGSEKD